MKKFFSTAYHWLESLPDHLYPFASEIEGKWERGINSYKKSLADAWEKYGEGHNGYKINVYRSTWHVLGSIIFLVLATIAAQYLFNSEIALYVLVAVAVVLLLLQEFVAHPRRYRQLRRKSILDVLTWVLPMVAYLTFMY